LRIVRIVLDAGSVVVFRPVADAHLGIIASTVARP